MGEDYCAPASSSSRADETASGFSRGMKWPAPPITRCATSDANAAAFGRRRLRRRARDAIVGAVKSNRGRLNFRTPGPVALPWP